MDNRPIGIFDSGVGGLSAVRVMVQKALRERIVYFGDTARVPYGDRTAEEIKALSLQDARFLQTKGVKALVIACNTITANALPELTAQAKGIPVIGVIEPAAAQAARMTRSGRVGVIATNATVRSQVYEAAISARCPGAAVTAQGCPELVPLIESGHTAPEDDLLMPVLERYLAPMRAAEVDTLVLGCTHFPLIREAVQKIMGPEVQLVDSGAACVSVVLDALKAVEGLASEDAPGGEAYYCSARRDDFTAIAQRFLGRSVEQMTEEICIDVY